MARRFLTRLKSWTSTTSSASGGDLDSPSHPPSSPARTGSISGSLGPSGRLTPVRTDIFPNNLPFQISADDPLSAPHVPLSPGVRPSTARTYSYDVLHTRSNSNATTVSHSHSCYQTAGSPLQSPPQHCRDTQPQPVSPRTRPQSPEKPPLPHHRRGSLSFQAKGIVVGPAFEPEPRLSLPDADPSTTGALQSPRAAMQQRLNLAPVSQDTESKQDRDHKQERKPDQDPNRDRDQQPGCCESDGDHSQKQQESQSHVSSLDSSSSSPASPKKLAVNRNSQHPSNPLEVPTPVPTPVPAPAPASIPVRPLSSSPSTGSLQLKPLPPIPPNCDHRRQYQSAPLSNSGSAASTPTAAPPNHSRNNQTESPRFVSAEPDFRITPATAIPAPQPTPAPSSPTPGLTVNSPSPVDSPILPSNPSHSDFSGDFCPPGTPVPTNPKPLSPDPKLSPTAAPIPLPQPSTSSRPRDRPRNPSYPQSPGRLTQQLGGLGQCYPQYWNHLNSNDNDGYCDCDPDYEQSEYDNDDPEDYFDKRNYQPRNNYGYNPTCEAHGDYFGQVRDSIANLPMGNRPALHKVWVKRLDSSATQVLIREDDLVDSVRDVILRKFANSLGRHFDSADLTLCLNGRSVDTMRSLGPEELLWEVITGAYPNGQTIREALVITDSNSTHRFGKKSPRFITTIEPPKEGSDGYFHDLPSMPPRGKAPSPGPGQKWKRFDRTRRPLTSSPPATKPIQNIASGTSNSGNNNNNSDNYLEDDSPAKEPSSKKPPETRPVKPQSPIQSQRKPANEKVRKIEATPATPPQPQAPEPAPSLPNTLTAAIPPIRVLIVEDNPINLKLIHTFIGRLKVRREKATNGADAVKKWREGGFHLILMDLQLPIMNGLDATREIRRLERINKISKHGIDMNNDSADGSEEIVDPKDVLTNPEMHKGEVIIVALTASSLASDRRRALAAGCNDFLSKPVHLPFLQQKILEWGCMQALIDFDNWGRWKDMAADEEEQERLKREKTTTTTTKKKKKKKDVPTED